MDEENHQPLSSANDRQSTRDTRDLPKRSDRDRNSMASRRCHSNHKCRGTLGGICLGRVVQVGVAAL